MSSVTEVHRLVVTLTGNGRQFQQMIDQVIDSSDEYAATLRRLNATTREYRNVIHQQALVTSQAQIAVRQYQRDLDTLQRRYDTGRISLDQFNQDSAQLRGRVVDAGVALATFNQMMERGAQVTQQNITAEQRHAQTMRELNALLSYGAITRRTYNEAQMASINTLPRVIAAQRRENEELRRAQQLIQATLTPLERYEQELRELDGLLQRNRISQTVYNRAVQQAYEAFNRVQPAATNWGLTLTRTGRDIRNFGMNWSIYITAPPH